MNTQWISDEASQSIAIQKSKQINTTDSHIDAAAET